MDDFDESDEARELDDYDLEQSIEQYKLNQEWEIIENE